MPRALALLLLLPAASCKNVLSEPYDPGRTVHFIVHLSPRPERRVKILPTCTVGSHVARTRRRIWVDPDGADAVEVAALRVPAGEYRIAVWDPYTRGEGRTTEKVRAELWVVLEVDPGDGDSRLRVFDAPPQDSIGRWRPLVTVPD